MLHKKWLAALLAFAMLVGMLPAMAQTANAASIAGTVSFTGTWRVNLGQVAHDGQTVPNATSTDIPGIQLDIFGTNESSYSTNPVVAGSMVYTDSLETMTTHGAIFPMDRENDVYNFDFPPKALVIKSHDGTAFSFLSIYLSDYFPGQTHAIFEGFRNGVSTGSVDLIRPETELEKTYSTANGLTESIFGNVDEVRMTNGAPGWTTYAGVNHIQIGDPVVPVSAPVFTSGATASYAENETGPAYTAQATGTGAITYSLSGGADQALFEVEASTGAVHFIGSPDYEQPLDSDHDNVYQITVKAADSGGEKTQDVAITVMDIPDVHFSFSDNTDVSSGGLVNDHISSHSLKRTLPVVGGGTVDITFTTLAEGGNPFTAIYPPHASSTFPGGLYNYSGKDSETKLLISAPPGYTFNLLSFKYATWMNAMDQIHVGTQDSPSYYGSYDVTKDGSKGYTTLNAFTPAVSNVRSVVISAKDYTELQDIEIANIQYTASSDATLQNSSTVKGQEAASLGTPNAVLGSVIAGSVDLTAGQAADTSNSGLFVTNFVKNDPRASVKAVKYSFGAQPEGSFDTDVAYANEAVGQGDFFIVRVTAEDASVLYYRIEANIENSVPVVTTSGGNTAYSQSGTNTVAVDPGLTVTDSDDLTLSSATIAIAGFFQSDMDVLTFTNTSPVDYGNIVGSYNAITGELTLTSSGATATVAQWQQALRNVAFGIIDGIPGINLRVFSFEVNDGRGKSDVVLKYMDIVPKLEAPVPTGWDITLPAVAVWTSVSNADSYTVQLYKDGNAVGAPVTGVTGTSYDFTSAITESGSYTFKVVAVGDGISYTNSDQSAASSAYAYTAVTKLTPPVIRVWDEVLPGKAVWTAVAHASSYTVQLYKDGNAVGAPVTGVTDLNYDFTSQITDSGSYTFKVVAVGDGISYTNSDESAASSAYAYTVPSVPPVARVTYHDGTDHSQDYPTFQDAVAAVNGLGSGASNIKITLLADASMYGGWIALLKQTGARAGDLPSKPTVLDGGGHTLTSTTHTINLNADLTLQNIRLVTETLYYGGRYLVAASPDVSIPYNLTINQGVVLDDAAHFWLVGGAGINGTSLIAERTSELSLNGDLVSSQIFNFSRVSLADDVTATLSRIYLFGSLVPGENSAFAFTGSHVEGNFEWPAGGLTGTDEVMFKAAAGYTPSLGDKVIKISGNLLLPENPHLVLDPVTYAGFVLNRSQGLAGTDYYILSLPAAKLGTPAGLAWDEVVPGKAVWTAVAHASSYTVQLYKDGNAVGAPVTGVTATNYDFTSVITDSGSYTFKVTAVGDGTNYTNSDESTASSGYVYTAVTKLTPPATRVWDEVVPGKAVWTAVAHASSYTVQLYKDGNAVGAPVTGVTATNYDFTSAITDSGSYTFKVTAVGDGTNYTNSDESTASSGYVYTAVTKLTPPATRVWDEVVPGKAVWTAVAHASSYTVQLYKDGNAVGAPVTGVTATNYDFTSAITDSGSYTFKVTAVGDGTNYTNSDESTASSGYGYTVPNVPPVVTTTIGLTLFNQNSLTPVAVDPALSVVDADQTTLSSAAVTITGGFLSTEDVLAFTNVSEAVYGNIAASYNATTGVLTLTSSGAAATVAQWQQALRAVTYVNTAGITATGLRVINFIVNDGSNSSAPASKTISIVPYVAPKLDTPAGLGWDATVPGKAVWTGVPQATGYMVQLYKDGLIYGEPISVSGATYEYHFASDIMAAGSYTFKIVAVGDGTNQTGSDPSEASIPLNAYLVEYQTGNQPNTKQVAIQGSKLTMPDQPVRSGYAFGGWYMDPEFTTKWNFDTDTVTGAVALYGQWIKNTFTVVYVGNEATSGEVPVDQQAYASGTTVTVKGNTGSLDKTGFIFSGWSSGTAIYSADQTFTIQGDTTLSAVWTPVAAKPYLVSGTVLDDRANPLPVNGATVTLYKGNEHAGVAGITDEAGQFSLSGVADGIYSLVIASADGKGKVTVGIRVSGQDLSVGTITLPQGDKNAVLSVVPGTMPVMAEGLKELLADEAVLNNSLQQLVNNGGSVEVKLTIQPELDAAGQARVQAVLNARGYASGNMLDISLLRTATDLHGVVQDQTAVTSTSSLLKLTFELPAELQGKSSYTVYRAHDFQGSRGWVVDAITASTDASKERIELSSDGRYLILYAKYFSTYAIAYPNGTNGSTDDGEDSSSGSAGSVSHYTIKAGANAEGGSIGPVGDIQVTAGGTQTFTITPNQGYVIADVLVNGKSVGPVSSYTFSSVTSASTIEAVFAKAAGLPYYLNADGSKVFVGFASDARGTMKYIAPEGKTVLFQPNPKNFTDVAGHWGKASIDFVTEREIFEGTDQQVFSPDTGMTRAMLATVLGRLYERSYGSLSISGQSVFTDADYSSWYGAYIGWAAEKGIVEGVGGGLFEPDRQVTRQEMAAMLYRFAAFIKADTGAAAAGKSLQYTDANHIADWASAAALYGQEAGLISGRDGGRFAPAETATRAEVAAILERFIQHVLK